jgi:hypothetical protein
MSLPRTWVQTLQYFAEGVATEQRVSEGDIPTPDQFAAFVNMGLCPFEARLEAAVRLNRLLAVMGVVETPGLPKEVKEWLEDLDDGALLELIPDRKFIVISRITTDGILEGESLESEEFRLSVLELENTRRQIFSKYLALNSFLVPLMEAWVKHPELRSVEPERRQRRIMPEPIRYAVPSVAALPIPTGSELPEFGQQPPGTAYLPGLEPPPGVVVPVLPLQVAKVSTAGAGAPITPRLWFGFQIALPLNRRTGEEVRLLFTLRDVCTWLWPNGWNRGRDLPRLREGLRNLYQLGIIWNRGEWLLVRPVRLPILETRLDDYLIVDVTGLPGSDRGPMIDTQRLWRLGATAGAPWRMWIRLAYIWDAVKTQNGGNRIYATRPEVKRGEGGVILDQHGRPVLDRHRRPVLDWSDKRAVRTGRQERHPQAGRVPALGMRDLALLGFDNTKVPAGTLRRRAAETRSWLTKIEEMGFVALENEGKEVRVLETYPEQ